MKSVQATREDPTITSVSCHKDTQATTAAEWSGLVSQFMQQMCSGTSEQAMSDITDDEVTAMQSVWDEFSGVPVTGENTRRLNKALLAAVLPAHDQRTEADLILELIGSLVDGTVTLDTGEVVSAKTWLLRRLSWQTAEENGADK